MEVQRQARVSSKVQTKFVLTTPLELGSRPHIPSSVCVFRLLSTKLQPPGGTIVTAPSGLRSRVCGQSLRPSLAPNHFWLPTTYLLLRDSRGTHPLCVYVREYGMLYVRGYVLGEEGVNVSTSRGRNSKLKGNKKCSVCDYDGTSSQGVGYVRGCSGASRN